MEAAGFAETSVDMYKTTRRCMTEDGDLRNQFVSCAVIRKVSLMVIGKLCWYFEYIREGERKENGFGIDLCSEAEKLNGNKFLVVSAGFRFFDPPSTCQRLYRSTDDDKRLARNVEVCRQRWRTRTLHFVVLKSTTIRFTCDIARTQLCVRYKPVTVPMHIHEVSLQK